MPVGSNIDLGDVLLTPGLSAGSLNADLVSWTDVSNWKWVNLFIDSSSYTGTLTFQGSFDGVNPIDITFYRLGNLDGAHCVSSIDNETSTLFGGPVRFPWFRCRMTGYTSGTATGVLQLKNEGPSGLELIGMNRAAGVLSGQFVIGTITNDGTHNAVIAAGVASDTVIYAGKSMLSSVLVTTTGTNQMLFYDNASVGSGTIIGLIPANPTVNGVPFVFKAFCTNGIVAKGNANNPAITVFYTDIF